LAGKRETEMMSHFALDLLHWSLLALEQSTSITCYSSCQLENMTYLLDDKVFCNATEKFFNDRK